jgi:beta-lactamase regulating signal transducer with metallopeptidase domain
MNPIINFLRCVLLTIIILPVWVSICIAGLIVAILLHYVFSNKQNTEERYRNNMKKIIREFKNDIVSIFYYY